MNPIRKYLAAAACLAVASVIQADPLLDREIITTAFPLPHVDGDLDMTEGSIACPDETILITGGAWIFSDNNGIPAEIALISSHPNGNGWTAQAREMADTPPSNLADNLLVQVVCGYTHRSGSAHIQVVTTNVTLNRSSGNLDLVQGTAACPSGKTLISGGAKIFANTNLVPQSVVLMTSKATGNSWTATAREVADFPQSPAQLSVRAVCADAGSGISAPQLVTTTVDFPDNPASLDVAFGSATCPAGKSRIGGGAEILSSNNGIPPYLTLMTAEPTGSNAWSAVARETQAPLRGPIIDRLYTTANCATLSGVTGLQVVTKTFALPAQEGVSDAVTGTVYCPAGKTMIGGGAKILSSNNGIPPFIALMASAPSANGWIGVARETQDNPPSAITDNLIVSAVCAVLPP